ncbi:uncharacterized protein Pyn_05681 [Prunus yedoensis var. nudiflora]|uniref:Structural polyprotein n=1 Tax=Prunus yedoensis var. nudiflora TaxID=2094558 RepID=A0A314YKL8_PRUYE|nr:uncharacterized protein Pyn_05681 [Prunus yedoensis var. nudiflora]
MPSDSSLFLLLFFFVAFALLSVGHATIQSDESEGIGRRALLSLKETPRGSNTTFECSPAGPCVPCLYSEKKDEKYRCSETGYRIPLKCVETKRNSKDEKAKGYITYRSCIPAVSEEKLSVLGFEVIVLFFLLISGSVVYFRRKQTVSMTGFGAGRIQSNSRF